MKQSVYYAITRCVTFLETKLDTLALRMLGMSKHWYLAVFLIGSNTPVYGITYSYSLGFIIACC